MKGEVPSKEGVIIEFSYRLVKAKTSSIRAT